MRTALACSHTSRLVFHSLVLSSLLSFYERLPPPQKKNFYFQPEDMKHFWAGSCKLEEKLCSQVMICGLLVFLLNASMLIYSPRFRWSDCYSRSRLGISPRSSCPNVTVSDPAVGASIKPVVHRGRNLARRASEHETAHVKSLILFFLSPLFGPINTCEKVERLEGGGVRRSLLSCVIRRIVTFPSI